MAETIEHERTEQRTALDNFAKAAGNTPMVPPAIPQPAGPAERVFGAQQVAVYRDEQRILQKLKFLGEAAGDHWYYRFPVKSAGGGQDWVEGPSIKCANDLSRVYGNCDVDCRAIDLGDSWIFYARFTDYETGYSLTRPFQQRKSQRGMKAQNDRALDIAFQIGVSKAIRNVVVNALQTYADYAFECARDSLVEKIGKNLDAWRTRTIEAVAKMKCELPRVERVMGRASKDWTAPDIARIVAMMKSVHDGMATVDETFPLPETEVSAAGASPRQNDPVAGQPASASDPKSPPNPEGEAGAGTTQPPTTEATYIGYANAWIARSSDPSALEAWWLSSSEKKNRNKCNVSRETFDELEKAMKEKVAALRKK